MNIKINQYPFIVDSVVKWTVQDDNVAIDDHRTRVIEKIEGLTTAITNNDKTNTVSYTCELVVEAIRLSYHVTGISQARTEELNHNTVRDTSILDVIERLQHNVEETHPSHQTIQHLIAWCSSTYGGELVTEYMTATLESLCTMLVRADKWKLKRELAEAEKRRRVPSSDIAVVTAEVDGVAYCAMRTKSTGKLVKPTTYKSPLSLLSDQAASELGLSKTKNSNRYS